MRHQLTGFQISIAIHALVVVLILAVSGSFIPRTGLLVIDFTVEPGCTTRTGIADKAASGFGMGSRTRDCDAPQSEAGAAKPNVEAKAACVQGRDIEDGVSSVSMVSSSEAPDKREQSMPTVSVDSVIEAAVPGAPSSITGASSYPEKHPCEQSPGWANGRDQGSLSGGNQAATGSYDGMEASGSGMAVFPGDGHNDIVGMVRRKMEKMPYPKRAREMGWEGSVEISFYLLQNGRVRDIRLEKGSGRSALDQSAIDFVREFRFPKPSREGWLKLPPIRFKLK